MLFNKELFFDDLYKFWTYSMRESESEKKNSRSINNIDWAGGLTWDDAKSMAFSGWVEGMQHIEKYRAEILPRITDKVLRVTPKYDMVGHSVDIGRYLSNEPECFYNRDIEEKNYPGRIIKLVCSNSFSASVKSEVIIQRGAMVCALIDAIEYSGHRVEVILNRTSTNNNDSFEVSVVLKKANQHIDMTDLAFCLAHPSMLRRILFSLEELEGWADYADRYGRPGSARDKGDLYIDEILTSQCDIDKMIEWVLNQLIDLGVNIEKISD